MMNRSMLIGCVTGAAIMVASGAVAGYQWNHAKTLEAAITAQQAQFADVINVVAVNEKTVTPHRECHQHTVKHRAAVRDPYQLIGTGTGAVLGGVIGHQVGKGRGKDAATVIGALAGGYTGNRIQQGMQERDWKTTTVNRCSTVNVVKETPVGYDVTYRYNGMENTVRMDHRPSGNRLQVSKQVVFQDTVPALNVPAQIATNYD